MYVFTVKFILIAFELSRSLKMHKTYNISKTKIRAKIFNLNTKRKFSKTLNNLYS